MRRVGGTKDIDLDVRILIASNELLWNATRTGKFREDLYHRFNEFSIEIPPLRERPRRHHAFCQSFSPGPPMKNLGKQVKGFDPDVEEIFKKYVWYGNLRELKNVIKRATLLTEGDYIESRTLPFEISNYSKLQFADQPPEIVGCRQGTHANAPETKLRMGKINLSESSLKEASIDAEYEMILQALKESNYNKSKAAQLLKSTGKRCTIK